MNIKEIEGTTDTITKEEIKRCIIFMEDRLLGLRDLYHKLNDHESVTIKFKNHL